jgi:hypothetical protein
VVFSFKDSVSATFKNFADCSKVLSRQYVKLLPSYEKAFRREACAIRDGGSMEFSTKFEKAVAKMNEKRAKDPRIQEALNRYNRRSLVFKVRNDATYVFYFSRDGVRYEVNPSKEPKSMYVEMDLERAKKLVYKRSFGIFDVLATVHRNIKMADISFARRLFEGK